MSSPQQQLPGTPGSPDVTALLLAWRAGDRAALDALEPVVYDEPADVLAVHEALERLAAFDRERGRLVELRYFAGVTIAETAAALGGSPTTANREWGVASAWLRRELEDGAA